MILHIDTKDPQVVRVTLEDKKGDEVECLVAENEFGSQVLLPLIVELLKNQGLSFTGLTGIKVEKGPGSFTGLRVGAAVAQALGFALNIPVNGVVNKPVKLRYT